MHMCRIPHGNQHNIKMASQQHHLADVAQSLQTAFGGCFMAAKHILATQNLMGLEPAS